jgi:release factor glutamine methyltransferase
MKLIADAFARAAELGIERADAMVLMSARTGFTRATLLAFGERELALHAAQLEDDFAQRAQGVPVAYLIGYQEFFGLRLQVSPAVLVPRADTETVVEAILAAELPRHAQMLDLGTGSGAIALAVKSQRPDWHVTAVDQSSAALEIAQKNAKTYQLAIEWRLGDWFAPLENGQRFDLIASNPPYLDARDAHLHDLRFEPLQALTAANSGLADCSTSSIAPQAFCGQRLG